MYNQMLLDEIQEKLNQGKIKLNGVRKRDLMSMIKALKEEYGHRELLILGDLVEVEKNKDVPSNYMIYKFYDSFGDGFEGGDTPNGFGITN